VCRFSKEEWGVGAFRFSTEREDKIEGADMYVLGVPIDFTLCIGKATRMRKIKTTIKIDGYAFEFGVRYGNAYHTYAQPVLVIGVEGGTKITKSNAYVLVDSIKRNCKNILNTAMDCYFDVVPA
jgi:hypothetical protein